MTDFGHTIGDARKKSQGNVVPFPTDGASTNRRCPKCGGEWWIVQAVAIDNDSGSVGGYAGFPICHECTTGGELVVLDGEK